MGGLNAMQSYLEYFDMKSASSSTRFVFAIYGIGSIAAVSFCRPLNNWFGRRAALFVGSLIVILGACVAGASKMHGMFLGGEHVGSTHAPPTFEHQPTGFVLGHSRPCLSWRFLATDDGKYPNDWEQAAYEIEISSIGSVLEVFYAKSAVSLLVP
ncbi:hypothetical protein BDW59DRAFT_166360 [Aspergillus cavernicola]|uniref:Major facilitator superfamily (MFS) profile domain-containing protein n=1 Tax=Aspergillus cavernicola TaxID=176166 RepID=A0ABR4HLS0_9EURO